ncbi:transcriptional repressor LexA [Hominifimenecus sp. rT4P-3]|uniref:transcriptional repressor LexA n=1 Tax=Hominifimenecus sp. rT4P-3 TaxID=3242979 RepID=UPI003DA2F365
MAYGKISAKQEEVLNFIKRETLKKGYPPAVREICEAVHLKSTSSVHAHLATLEKNGYIRRDPTKPRAIEIIDDEFSLARREMIQIPIVGQVAAGEPIFAEQNIQDYFAMPADMVPEGNLFMLNVKGESMVNMGILDGDSVICRQQETAHNGEVVAVLVDDSATIKRFYRESGHFRLQPENDYMDPIIVQDCRILGKVVSLVRMRIH